MSKATGWFDERTHAFHEPGLTPQEIEVVEDLGRVWNKLCRVVADGPTRDPDLAEAVRHIHALQHAVMAQAAARAHPERFRLLGDVIP